MTNDKLPFSQWTKPVDPLDPDLVTAKRAYQIVMHAVVFAESTPQVCCNWAGCITVNGKLFNETDLEYKPKDAS